MSKETKKMTPTEFTTLAPAQVAAMLGVKDSTLRYWRAENRGPRYVRLSSRLFRYDKRDVERYINEHAVDPSARASLENRHVARP